MRAGVGRIQEWAEQPPEDVAAARAVPIREGQAGEVCRDEDACRHDERAGDIDHEGMQGTRRMNVTAQVLMVAIICRFRS